MSPEGEVISVTYTADDTGTIHQIIIIIMIIIIIIIIIMFRWWKILLCILLVIIYKFCKSSDINDGSQDSEEQKRIQWIRFEVFFWY